MRSRCHVIQNMKVESQVTSQFIANTWFLVTLLHEEEPNRPSTFLKVVISSETNGFVLFVSDAITKAFQDLSFTTDHLENVASFKLKKYLKLITRDPILRKYSKGNITNNRKFYIVIINLGSRQICDNTMQDNCHKVLSMDDRPTAELVICNTSWAKLTTKCLLITPPRHRGGFIFSLQFVCVSVCVSVCPEFLWTKFQPNGCTDLNAVFAK